MSYVPLSPAYKKPYELIPNPQMNPQRPPLRAGSPSGPAAYASQQSLDSIFRELRGRTVRPKSSEIGSDTTASPGASTTPKRSRSPKRRRSPSTSTQATESFSQLSSTANDAVDDTPDYYTPPRSQLVLNQRISTPAVGDPPRPAKPGYEWVWFPDPLGYWAERPEIPRSSPNTPKSLSIWKRISFAGKASSPSVERRPSLAERHSSSVERRKSNATWAQSDAELKKSLSVFQEDTESNRSSDFIAEQAPANPETLQQKVSKGLQLLSPIKNSRTGEGEGFFKIVLGKGKKVEEQIPSDSSLGSAKSMLSQTALLLKGVAEFFEHGQDRHWSSSSSKRSSDSNKPRKRKGLFSRRKRNSQDSHFSLTDSLREVLMGKTPVVTPIAQQKYVASDGKAYAKVEMTTKNAPTYLPSEATRIHTPPLPDEVPGVPTRGFFFDLSPTAVEEPQRQSMECTSPIKLGRTPSQNGQTYRKLGFGSPKSASGEPPTPGTRNRMVRLRQMWEHGFRNHEIKEEKVSNFELDVPEHYPNSPLCPRNPMHKSRGTGICVYHGRNKKDS